MLYDKDIREPLFDFLDETYGKIRILEEKTIGRSRADVIMVAPTALYGLEIKSDADTYARLSSQIKDYDKYYDFNYVVVGTSHALHIEEHVPEYWGIITVELEDNMPDFYILRRPKNNPHVTWQKKLDLLWRPELALLQIFFQLPKYKDKSKSFVITKIIERLEQGSIDAKDLNMQLCDILMERDYTTASDMIKQYRKSELSKLIERETDPSIQLELMQKKSLMTGRFKRKSKHSRHK